jgi:hypothetical protein
MRRLLWLGVGLAVGALVVRKVNQVARAYSPSGLAASARESGVGVLASVRDFMADVRAGMAEREEQIHEAFERGVGLDEVLVERTGAARPADQERPRADTNGSENGAGVRR